VIAEVGVAYVVVRGEKNEVEDKVVDVKCRLA